VRIEPADDSRGDAVDLVDDGVTLSPPDDLLDLGEHVPALDEEAGRALPDSLVFLQRHLDPVRAAVVAALAEKLRFFRLESFGSLGDPFVDGAEECLVPCDLGSC